MQQPAYETLFRLSPEASCVVDSDGRILDANEAYLALHGRSLEQVRGKLFSDLVVLDDASLARLAESFARARQAQVSDRAEVRAGWSVVHVPLPEASARPGAYLQCHLRSEETGTPIAARAIESDGQAQRLQSVGRLAGGVAHAFNNILQVVGGNLQLLRRGLVNDAAAIRRLESALDGVERGGRLAAQLLTFTARQSADSAPVHLGERVEGMLELLSAVLGQGVDVRLDVSPGLWPVVGDAAELEDLLVELAASARQAIQGRGALCVRLSNSRLDDAGAGPVGDYVVLRLSDRAGSEVRDRPVLPLVISARSSAMASADRASIERLAARLGGFVRHGEQSAGFVLEVFLPRAPMPLDEGEDESCDDDQASPADAPAQQLKVLFIEDDPTLRMLTGEVMVELGHDVVLGASAEDALSRLSRESFDVLFTDVGLPGMDGLELARQARSRDPGLVVVIASGYMVDAAAEGLDGVHCVLKPYDIEGVRVLLESVPVRSRR